MKHKTDQVGACEKKIYRLEEELRVAGKRRGEAQERVRKVEDKVRVLGKEKKGWEERRAEFEKEVELLRGELSRVVAWNRTAAASLLAEAESAVERAGL